MGYDQSRKLIRLLFNLILSFNSTKCILSACEVEMSFHMVLT